MVGLTISMLVVAAMMLVLRNLAHTTGEAKVDAQIDDRLVSSLLSAGLTLHEAGFQIDKPKLGTALVIISDAQLNGGKLTGTLRSSGEGNLVIWQQQLGSQIQCIGLLAPKKGGLTRVLGPASPDPPCTNIGTWESLNWTEEVIAPAPDPDKTDSPFALKINVEEGVCAPFGISSPAMHLRVTLAASNSSSNSLTTVECLGNFITAAPASS